MKNATKFLALVSIIYMCIINGKSSGSSARALAPNESLNLADQIQSLNVPDHENFAESPLSLDDISSSLEQYEALMSNEHPRRINPLFGHRRSDSAEKYFDWASKTQRKLDTSVRSRRSPVLLLLVRPYGILSGQALLAVHEEERARAQF